MPTEIYRPLIYIVDDDDINLRFMQHMLTEFMPHLRIKTFLDKSFLEDDLKEADLVIMDIVVGYENGVDIMSKVLIDHPNLPVLFVTGFSNEASKIESIPPDCVVDFIFKPVNHMVFINRVKVLLRASTRSYILNKEKDQAEKNIWTLLQHVVGTYIIVSNLEGKILSCNDYFCKDIGYEKTDLLNKTWSDLISELEYKILTDRIKLESFTEAVFSIKTIDGSPCYIKWFHSLINDKNNLILGVGAPLIKDRGENDVDSVRNYFQNLITRDRFVIESLKKTVNA